MCWRRRHNVLETKCTKSGSLLFFILQLLTSKRKLYMPRICSSIYENEQKELQILQSRLLLQQYSCIDCLTSICLQTSNRHETQYVKYKISKSKSWTELLQFPLPCRDGQHCIFFRQEQSSRNNLIHSPSSMTEEFN